jgi:hypothetical protein
VTELLVGQMEGLAAALQPWTEGERIYVHWKLRHPAGDSGETYSSTAPLTLSRSCPARPGPQPRGGMVE